MGRIRYTFLRLLTHNFHCEDSLWIGRGNPRLFLMISLPVPYFLLQLETYFRLTATVSTREGCPLLTVETEANGDLWSTNERGPSFVGSLGLLCRNKICLSYPGCFSQPSTKYFSFTAHYFTFCVPIAQQAGQAVVPGRLSVNNESLAATVFNWRS